MSGTTPTRPGFERRRHPRTGGLVATAVVLSRGRYAGTFVVENLSAGGALLIGDPRLECQERIDVLLYLQQRRTLALRAEVVHQGALESGEHVFAVAFLNVPAESEAILQRIVLAELERERHFSRPTVLVVDDSGDIRRALERDLRTLGREAISAATPLEAVWHLEEPRFSLDTAFVDLCLGPADGTDVLAYLADAHPHITRVLMSGQTRPCQLQLALASGRAHEILSKPWDPPRLANILYRC